MMGTIDAAIVNVAMPHLRGAVGATVQEITWVSTSFVLATVLVMPLTAFMGRLFGQKRFYLFCLSLFLVGSVLCGMARSLTALVIFRVVQGLGAGALLPTEQAILRQTFPPEEQGVAMSFFGMAVMVGPALGPSLGGLILDSWPWPWIFYVNVPVGLLGLFMVHRFVHDPEDIAAYNRKMAASQRKNLDWAGIALVAVGLGSLQYVLEEGERFDWFASPRIAVLAFVSVFSLAAFAIRELTAPVPAVHLGLLRHRRFSAGATVNAVTYAMLFSVTFLLPVFMQELLGYSATQTGIYLMPRALVMFVTTAIVGRIYNRVSPRALIALGMGLFAVAAYQMGHYTLDTSHTGILAALILQGIGFGCVYVPASTLALSNIPREKLADAAGLNALLAQIFGSTGLALFAMLIGRFGASARAAVNAHVLEGRIDVRARLDHFSQLYEAHGRDAVSAHRAAGRAFSELISRQAMMLVFDKLFLLAGMCLVALLPLLLLLRKGPPLANVASSGQTSVVET